MNAVALAELIPMSGIPQPRVQMPNHPFHPENPGKELETLLEGTDTAWAQYKQGQGTRVYEHQGISGIFGQPLRNPPDPDDSSSIVLRQN